MRSAGLILLGILFIRCQLSIRNSCFSECMTPPYFGIRTSRYAQRIALCALRTLLRLRNDLYCVECGVKLYSLTHYGLCLALTRWILLYNFYACSNVYILIFFILLLCTDVRRSYEIMAGMVSVNDDNNFVNGSDNNKPNRLRYAEDTRVGFDFRAPKIKTDPCVFGISLLRVLIDKPTNMRTYPETDRRTNVDFIICRMAL